MLETVSQGFKAAKNILAGQTQLSEKNIAAALNEVRLSLLDADVEYTVVKKFLERVTEKSLGQTVKLTAKGARKLSPSDHFINICFKELEDLMGPQDNSLTFSKPIGTVMMVGLQGSGKTTTTAKLALYLKNKNYRPLLVGADIYRPAAIKQLETIGQGIGVPVYSDLSLKPPQLCESALLKAKELHCNVVIFDTAGRITLDDALMTELEQIKRLCKPDNTFLVVDAMIGQDAVHTAREFDRRIPLEGFILTKLDGDARGGAALSIKEVTGKPIKFLGMGEKLENIEEFRPSGLASRILGMGDVVGLVKDFEQHIDEEQAQKEAEKMLKGQFTLEDFLGQLKMLKKMGPIRGLLEKLPGVGDLLPANDNSHELEFVKIESMMNSMTQAERRNPQLFVKDKNRKIRVVRGSGRKAADLDQFLQKFSMMKKMMTMVGSNPKMLGQMAGMGQAAPASKATKKTGPSAKDKKNKRKREKTARKKNKR